MKTVIPFFRRYWARVYRVWRRGHHKILAGQLRDLVGSYVVVLAIAGIMISFFLIGAPSEESREPSS
jgi:hypothetical protein